MKSALKQAHLVSGVDVGACVQ